MSVAPGDRARTNGARHAGFGSLHRCWDNGTTLQRNLAERQREHEEHAEHGNGRQYGVDGSMRVSITAAIIAVAVPTIGKILCPRSPCASPTAASQA